MILCLFTALKLYLRLQTDVMSRAFPAVVLACLPCVTTRLAEYVLAMKTCPKLQNKSNVYRLARDSFLVWTLDWTPVELLL